MSAVSTLAQQLESAISSGAISLPNAAVSEVQITSFINNLIKSNNIQVASAKVVADTSSVTLTGELELFGVGLSIDWKFTYADEAWTWDFSASTTDTGDINKVLDHFLGSVPTLPSSVKNLTLTGIGISTSYDSHAKKYSLKLTAQTTWGEVDLAVVYNNGAWGAALGVELKSTVTLGDISSDLSIFDALTFSDSAVVISDFDDESLKLAGIDGVVKGIEFRSTLNLQQGSGSTNAVVAIENELAKSLSGTPLDVTIILSTTNAKITAGIPGPFSFPGYSKLMLSAVDFSFGVSTGGSVSAALAGTLDIPITIPGNPGVTSITVTGTISFTFSDGTGAVEATLSSDTKIVEPFNIQGFTLLDIGFGVDVSFGAETGAGLTFAGGFELGTQNLDAQFALTIEFTDDLPNPSLLYINVKNLSLPSIFSAVISSGVNLPSVLSDFKFNQLVFYWCDRAQQIPVGPLKGSTCQPGVGFNAGIDFWGFNTYAALMINQSSGIKGQADIDPINLLGGKIKVTGNGKGGNGVQPGGAFFDFDTTKQSFDASANASVLGLSTVADASISSDSFDINMKSNFDFLQDSIAVKFTDADHMSFASKLNIAFHASPVIKVGGVTLGTINVSAHLGGGIAVSVDGTSFSAKVDGSFSWNTHSFSFSYDVAGDLNSLADLATAIAKKVVDEATGIFGKYFSDVTNYLKAWAKGLFTDGEFILNVLKHAYGQSITEIVALLSTLQQGVHIDGDPDFHFDIGANVPSKHFHVDFGKIIDTHADAWVYGVHADVGASASFSTPSFDVSLVNVDAGAHFDMKMPPHAHADASSPHLDQSVHIDVHVGGGSVGVGGKVGVDTGVALTSIDLKAHFSGSAHVGVHADVAHIGKHYDAGDHVDFGI